MKKWRSVKFINVRDSGVYGESSGQRRLGKKRNQLMGSSIRDASRQIEGNDNMLWGSSDDWFTIFLAARADSCDSDLGPPQRSTGHASLFSQI